MLRCVFFNLTLCVYNPPPSPTNVSFVMGEVADIAVVRKLIFSIINLIKKQNNTIYLGRHINALILVVL